MNGFGAQVMVGGKGMTEMSASAPTEVGSCSKEQVREWRRQVAEQREILFRRNWKNMRHLLALRSREEEEAFDFVLEWYEEFGDVVGREKERQRLDKLISLGLDVNAPPQQVSV